MIFPRSTDESFVLPQSIIVEEKDELCTCLTSYFSGHRKSKCLLLNVINAINEKEEVVCFRCGRKGHYANSCYASKHIRGYPLIK
jgi:hypothetical protein